MSHELYAFNFKTCCGIELEVEYRVNHQPQVKYAWMYVRGNPIEVFDLLDSETQDLICDFALTDWQRRVAERNVCEAEASADAAREECLMKEEQ